MPKGEKSKRVLMSSVQHFNNFIINSSKEDWVASFLHKALTGGKLNYLTCEETHRRFQF